MRPACLSPDRWAWPRQFAFGAPVVAGIALERELADIVLTDSMPIWQVREAIAARSPEGWRLIDIHDVWLGAPPLAGQVAAADYRIDVGDTDAGAIAAAAEELGRRAVAA